MSEKFRGHNLEERNIERINQKGNFEFNVSEREDQMIERVVGDVIERIKEYNDDEKKEKINIVTPAGRTADKFFERFADEINRLGVNLEKIHFYVGEDIYPLKKDNPASFSGRLQRKLTDKLKIKAENVHLVEEEKTLEENIEMIKKLGEEGIDIFMAGLNESGAISGLRSTLQWQGESLDRVYIDLNKVSMLNEPDWFYKVYPDISAVLRSDVIKKYFPDEESRPTDFVTYGYIPIINAQNLMILASGEKKKAVERILSGLAVKSNLSGREVGKNRDNMQAISTAEIINSRHRSISFSKESKNTTIYLDENALPDEIQ